MLNRQPRRRDVIARVLVGGTLVALSLPILAPLILGTLVTRAINAAYVLTRMLGSSRGTRPPARADDRKP